MRRILGTVSLTLGLLTYLVAGPATATIVTFGFEGPVTIRFAESPAIDSFIRGEIAYDTRTPGRDYGGTWFYQDAIVSMRFSTESVTRSYEFGDIGVQNSTSLDPGLDPDWIRFLLDFEDPLQEIYIYGTDQGYLSSQELPDPLPTNGIDRVYMNWVEGFDGDYFEISSNSLRIIPAAIPEPGSVGLLIASLLSIAAATRRFPKAGRHVPG